MPLVDSLLTAVVRSDGDALVLHVGEKPYVVASSGPVELSRQPLGLGAMEGMLAQMLPADALRVLREMGAVEHEIEERPASAGDRFTVVAARGGDDIWIEMRRHRRLAPATVASPAPAATPAMAPAPAPDPVPASMAEPVPGPVAATAPVTVEPPVAIPPPGLEPEAPAPVAVWADPMRGSAATPAATDRAPVPLDVVEPQAAPFPVLSDAPPTAVVPEAVTEPDPLLAKAVVDNEPAAVSARLAEPEPVATAEPVVHEAAAAMTPVGAGAARVDLAADSTEAAGAEPVAPMREASGPVPADAATPLVMAEVVSAAANEPRGPIAEAVVTLSAVDAEPEPEPVVSSAAALAPAVTVAPEPEPVLAQTSPVVTPAAVVDAVASAPVSLPETPPVEAVPMATPSMRVPVAAESPAPEPATPAPVMTAAVTAAPVPAASPAAATVVASDATDEPSPEPTPVSAPHARPVDVPDAAVLRASWPSARLDSFVPETAHFDADEQPVLPGLAPEYEAIHRHGDVSRYEAPESLPAVVLSLTRDGARGNSGVTRGIARPGGIERLLRLAAARGASALYLTTQARPAVRVDGDIRLLDGEPALSSGDVEAAVLELAPEGAGEKESAEWIRDLQDVGRVRITTFRDYRGPGALLRMIQARPTSAEQLGLVREIQALATEPEGLVLVTGPRASGKSTLMSAFVDLINRQRNDYVISLEGQIRLVHESRGSLISQRELRGSAGDIVAAARSALRENPDVLVIEDLRSPDVLQVALDAAGSGLLVFASVTAASATAALERLVDLCPSEQRHAVRAGLAEHLRGVVAQVLLRKAGGGRLAARELVLNTSAVAALVGDGQLSQLPRAIDSGRKLGMAPLNDALVAFVQSGAVDVREAYRKADDKAGLLALLKREGIDTSFVERLA